MIRFGMHSSLWTGSWTVPAAENLIPQAAKHGLEVIEVPLFNPEAIDVAHTVALLEQYGIAPSASICLPPGDASALFPDRGERFVMRALEVAHSLGCTFLGGVTYSSLGWKSGKPPVEEEYANVARALKPVARRAQEYGIQLGLEPCNRYETHLINTAAQCLAVIERIGEPNLVCHLDTYHMNIEEKGFGNGFRVAGKYCSYVHLSESDRGVPGTGNVDFEDIFRTLAQIGFQGDLVIESFIALPPEIASALCVWRPVAKSAEEVLTQGVPYLKKLARDVGLIA
jgi:D-psicose/D-tagatose/L-ribulose 3-epimerase